MILELTLNIHWRIRNSFSKTTGENKIMNILRVPIKVLSNNGFFYFFLFWDNRLYKEARMKTKSQV
jgi:hypothetical protein